MSKIDAYPWAVPTEEQKVLFDSLSPEQQLDMLRQAINKDLENGTAEPLDRDEIRRKARQRAGLLPDEEKS